MSSYRSCMIPRMPMRGLRPCRAVIRVVSPSTSTPATSTLAVVVLVAGVQGVHLVGGQRRQLAEGPGQVDRARHVFAHHGGLHRVLPAPWPIASPPISANGPTGISPPNSSAIAVITHGMGSALAAHAVA